ncbi:MAG: hypothetical protein QOG75_7231 [Mycobacterium sp.]|jgi:hypothetical protein|nr:hypothetical protein [Mycobacterium sp.]
MFFGVKPSVRRRVRRPTGRSSPAGSYLLTRLDPAGASLAAANPSVAGNPENIVKHTMA